MRGFPKEIREIHCLIRLENGSFPLYGQLTGNGERLQECGLIRFSYADETYDEFKTLRGY